MLEKPLNEFICGKCGASVGYDGWLCEQCWNERDAKQLNKYGLVRHEGVEYACDCYGSGSDEKGNRWILVRHASSCRLGRKKIRPNEPLCDCLCGKEKDKEGNYKIIFRYELHDVGCHIRNLIQSGKKGLVESYI